MSRPARMPRGITLPELVAIVAGCEDGLQAS
jgi:hypothetical protein